MISLKKTSEHTHCGKFGNLLSHFFDKKFVKATFLWKKLLKSWFHEIFFRWVNFSFFPHCVLRMFVCHVVLYDTSIEPITTKEFHKSPKHQTLNCDRLVIYWIKKEWNWIIFRIFFFIFSWDFVGSDRKFYRIRS